MKKYPVLLIVSTVILIVLIPIGIDHLIIGNDIYSNISNSDWVSFLGSYIGSLIGAGVSIVGIFMTIKFSEKQSKNDREFMIEMNREERRLSIAPLILCRTGGKDDKNEIDGGFSFDLDGEDSNTPFNVVILITNVGIGDAVDFELNFVSYGDKNFGCGLHTEFFEKNSTMRVSIDLSINLIELPDDIDNIFGNTSDSFSQVDYTVLKKYQYGDHKIKMEIKYKDLTGNTYRQEVDLHIQTGFHKDETIYEHWGFTMSQLGVLMQRKLDILRTNCSTNKDLTGIIFWKRSDNYKIARIGMSFVT